MTTSSSSPEIYVRPGEEGAFAQFEANLRAELRPVGHVQDLHFTSILHAAWNIRRCHMLEATLQRECNSVGGLDPLLDDGLAAKIERIQLYARRAERTQIAATRELRTLQAEMLYRDAVIPKIAAEFPVTASFAGLQKELQRSAPGNTNWYMMRFHDQLASKSKKPATFENEPTQERAKAAA